MKKFFKKIREYIKNTAWIQPLLIVVVIFLVLFLLNPIKTGISNLVNSISTSSKMETITFEEYTQKVKASAEANDDKKMLFVFTAKDCEHCKDLYPVMNKYLKERTKDFEIYSVNLSTRTTSAKGTFYNKDKTAGYVSGNDNRDAIYYLDERIENYVSEVQPDASLLTEVTYEDNWSSYKYTYVSTPLFIWYIGGIEVKISNSFDSLVTDGTDGKDYESFKQFISFKNLEADDSWKNDFKFDLNPCKR